jgi:hypothetical protein
MIFCNGSEIKKIAESFQAEIQKETDRIGPLSFQDKASLGHVGHEATEFHVNCLA